MDLSLHTPFALTAGAYHAGTARPALGSLKCRGGALGAVCSSPHPYSPPHFLKSLWPSAQPLASTTSPPAASALDLTGSAALLNEAEAAAEECEVVNGREVVLGERSEEGKDDEKNFGGYLVQPLKNFNGMGVLLLPDVFGFRNNETRDFALRTACHGYCVLAVDLFRGSPWSESQSREEYAEWRAQKAGPPERVAQDIVTAAEALRDHLQEVALEAPPGVTPKIAVMGFCYGGGRALEALAQDAKEGRNLFSSGVVFYGTKFDAGAVAGDIKVPVIFFTGDQDEQVDVDSFKEVARKVPGSEVVVYPGRGHAFAHRPQNMDDDEDAEKAFQTAKQWLHEQLLGDSSSSST